MKRIILVVLVSFFLFFKAYDKSFHSIDAPVDNGKTTEAIIKAEKTFKKNKKKYGSIKYDGPGKFAEFESLIRTPYGKEFPEYPANNKLYELNKAYQHSLKVNSILKAEAEPPILGWEEKGPANVPGRTRGFLVLPGDPLNNTWLAGTVGGGIWKTTDGGNSWYNKTPNLPNLATTTIAMAPTHSNIIYAGTGEGFFNRGSVNGDGVFKSTDAGDSWVQLSATANNNDFRNINSIIVHPENPDILLLCANSGPNYPEFSSAIFKSTDGGIKWRQVYQADTRIQQLVFSPKDFSVQYATINSVGVIKSSDGGETWEQTGLLQTSGRIELAISPTKPSVIYAAAEGNMSGNSSNLFISEDAGASWTLVVEEGRKSNPNWFGTQGWYNNSLTVHPSDHNIVYAGGIDLWKMKMKQGVGQGANQVTSVDEINTKSFFAGSNWGAPFFYGALGKGTDWFEAENGYPIDVSNSDYVSVSINFGPGKKQKAHRFTVPEGHGAGVTPKEYIYKDYVEVPFEVWDLSANRQLMISFRDQRGDGFFDLEVRNQDDPAQGREYLFISAVDYKDEPDQRISQPAGMAYKNIYSIWPNLMEGAVWQEDLLPESSLIIKYGPVLHRYKNSQHLTDAYEEFDGKNKDVHPDHHSITFIPQTSGRYRIVSTNDGGVHVSKPASNPGEADGDWEFAGKGLNTGQFYGFDKRPRSEEYIGGMQDNGTWKSPRGKIPDASTDYIQQLGGDGFDVVWHYSDPKKIVASSQYNNFRISTDGGKIYRSAKTGLLDVGEDKAPFFSRLAYTISRPNTLYTIGASGVWKTENFGEDWKSIPISEDWTFGSFTNIKISLANPDIVWAGGAMSLSGRLHVSTDDGKTFNKVNNYEAVNLGRISGLATHPSQPHTAYALFSFAGSPKIVRTLDLGTTWEELSGYGKGSSSNNGFPDVAVYCLLVMPHKPETIWVGTEIGIVESKDNGTTWTLLNSNLPSVSVWAMKVVDDQVIVATHGRGIWSLKVPELQTTFTFDENILKNKLEIYNYPNPVEDFTVITFYLTDETDAQITIYSGDGKLVDTMDLGRHKRGQGFINWKAASTLSKGIYILKLTTKQGVVGNRMILW
ncbi:MAG: T9SS type A sorting domain-containing protein [Bacteroidota bacterium]|nr:T9SS type A sorting domain-containing protein [Bacteroidota bacterium]